MRRFARSAVLPAAMLVVVAMIIGLVQNSAAGHPLLLTSAGLPAVETIDESHGVERALRQGAVLIDARSSDQYAGFHIKGAVSVPYDDRAEYLSNLIRRVPSTTQVIVYCDEGCTAAPRLADWLRSHGWRDIAVFRGGIRLWRQQGNPVVTVGQS